MAVSDTKQKITDTMITLMETVPFEKIKVADITEAAGVSRQTFYYHFSNLFELYKWVIARDLDFGDSSETGLYAPSPFAILMSLCETAKRHKELTLAFLNGGYDKEMWEDVRGIFFRAVRSNMEYVSSGELDGQYLDLISYFFADGCIGIMKNWIADGMDCPVRDVCAKTAETFKIIFSDEIFARMKDNEVESLLSTPDFSLPQPRR